MEVGGRRSAATRKGDGVWSARFTRLSKYLARFLLVDLVCWRSEVGLLWMALAFREGTRGRSGFRTPEQPRGQSLLWAHRLEDAIPQDHPVRLLDYPPHSEAFADTFTAWAGRYVLLEGKPPYHPRALSGLYLYGMMTVITRPCIAKTLPRGG